MRRSNDTGAGESSPGAERRGHWLAAIALALVTAAAYCNSLRGPLILDDQSTIADNPTLRWPWHGWGPLRPPPDSLAGGRPLFNLSLALNYALEQTGVTGYHLTNLLIHWAAACALFGIVRLTLDRPGIADHIRRHSLGLAFASAALWALHPLQTSAVTYISERAESLMGLAYFLGFYCFIRGAEIGSSRLWPVLSVAAIAAGALVKESIVTAPVLILIYDRTFLAGSFRAAWQRRWPAYLGLAGSWALLAWVMSDLSQRGAGFGAGLPWWAYARTEAGVVLRYLHLALWPRSLVLDYGTAPFATTWSQAAPGLAAVGLLIAGIGLLAWRSPRCGFLGIWFLGTLAPTSSIVPIAGEPMAENRMYLPLAALITAAVLLLHRWLDRKAAGVLAGAGLLLGTATVARNQTYRSERAIWEDTVAKVPNNGRAQTQLGAIDLKLGRYAEADAHFERALQLDPNDFRAWHNRGIGAMKAGRLPEAIGFYRQALALRPNSAPLHNSLGAAFAAAGRRDEAVSEYAQAVQLQPDFELALDNLARALVSSGRWAEAATQYERILALQPANAENHYWFGWALQQSGRTEAAIVQFREAVRLGPNFLPARSRLAIALAQTGSKQEAVLQFAAIVSARPDDADAHANLALALRAAGRLDEAKAEWARSEELKARGPIPR